VNSVKGIATGQMHVRVRPVVTTKQLQPANSTRPNFSAML